MMMYCIVVGWLIITRYSKLNIHTVPNNTPLQVESHFFKNITFFYPAHQYPALKSVECGREEPGVL